MKLISKIAATALAVACVVPTAFAATIGTTSHVAAMKKMAHGKMMKGKMMHGKMMKGKMMHGKMMKGGKKM